MPKKKFVTGATATYHLLPRQEGQAPSSSHTWLRTDLNADFKPFAADNDTDSEETNRRAKSPLLVEETCEAGKFVTGLDEVDEERFLRTMGTDPKAVFVSATSIKGLSSSRANVSKAQSYTESYLPGSSESEEVGSEVEAVVSSFQEIELCPSDENYNDEYDDFFQQIIQEPKSSVAEARAKCEKLTRSKLTKIKEEAVGRSTDDTFDKLVQSYVSITDDLSLVIPRDNNNDRDILGALLETSENKELTERRASICATSDEVNMDSTPHTPTYKVPGSYQYSSVPNVHQRWDCESIVTTYSCLEHHPRLLSPSGFRRSAKTQHLEASLAGGGKSKPIPSEKGDLESFCMSSRDEIQIDEHSVDPPALSLAAHEYDCTWRQNISRKGETKEEKKERKAAVKAGRRQARSSKKQIKSAFKQEEVAMRQVNDHIPFKCSVMNLT